MQMYMHACMLLTRFSVYIIYIYGLLMKQNFKTKKQNFFFSSCFDSFFLSLMGYRSNEKMAHKRKYIIIIHIKISLLKQIGIQGPCD